MDSNNASSTKLDVYQIVTDRIINLLETGTAPWQKPWTDTGIPMNLLSKRTYRGVNLWLLLSLNFEQNLFLTWDQLKKLGGSVKQGEHGHVVVFWKTVPKQKEADETEKPKQRPMLRYYKVFNIAQCKDIPASHLETTLTTQDHNPILECEAVVANMPQCPPIKQQGQSAYYDTKQDFVNMPKRKSFKNVEGYYATLFHELVHSTGHEKRLNRATLTEMAEFGSDIYSIEELVAELGSAYLCNQTSILSNVEKNSVAYIQGWIAKLKNDKRFIVQASGQAQRAVDFILNQQVPTDDAKEVEQSELLT